MFSGRISPYACTKCKAKWFECPSCKRITKEANECLFDDCGAVAKRNFLNTYGNECLVCGQSYDAHKNMFGHTFVNKHPRTASAYASMFELF